MNHFDFIVMGSGRRWAEGLLSLDTYISLQFWAAAIVLAASLPQLHLSRKFRFPPEPGRMTLIGGWLGITLRNARLALWLADVGTCLDFAALIIGRVGIAMQAAVALFALDDVMAMPTSPRPLVTWLLVGIVMVQARSLTAYTPRETEK